MNTDHYYTIGNSHRVCEDYALSGVSGDKESAFAIVSDGCSSSLDVDVGARTLALCARRALMEGRNDFLSVICSARDVVGLMGLPAEVLDATLLVARASNHMQKVWVWGDGLIVFQFPTGMWEAYLVQYKSGAPYYLSYELDSQRKKEYLGEFADDKCIYRMRSGNGYEWEGGLLSSTKTLDQPYEISWGNAVKVALISDGIMSFSMATGQHYGWVELLGEFIRYKNTNGAFVQRRMQFLKRRCEKEGVTHHDDVSIATIVGDRGVGGKEVP